MNNGKIKKKKYVLSRCVRSLITIYSCSSLMAARRSASSRISFSKGSICAIHNIAKYVSFIHLFNGDAIHFFDLY